MSIGSQQITGLYAHVIAELFAEMGPLWHGRYQAVLTARTRRRAVGAPGGTRLVFVGLSHWSSSWPTGPRWRTLPRPATRDRERGPEAVW